MLRETGAGRGVSEERRLTTDLARENPERYKAQLIDTLRAKTHYAGKVWEHFKARGVFSDDALMLDPSTWISETRMISVGPAKVIRLGIEELPSEVRAKLLFEDERFKGDAGITYRLSHEIGHEVGFTAATIDDGMNKLFSVIAKMRAQGNAMSTLGNLDMYARGGANIQATEDLVELVNMYMIDPEYLTRYLHFLTNPGRQSERDHLGLYTIASPQVSSLILRSIESGVHSVLSS